MDLVKLKENLLIPEKPGSTSGLSDRCIRNQIQLPSLNEEPKPKGNWSVLWVVAA